MNLLKSLSLIGFFAIWALYAEDDGEDDSTSTAEVIVALDADTATISSDGFGIRVYEEDGKPRLVFYNSNDAYEAVYCLIFEESFELSNSFNESTCGGDESLDHYEVDNSDVDFGDLDWTYDSCDGTNPDYTDCEFAFYTSSEKFDLLSFIFHLDYSNTTDEYYVKFDVYMEGYSWTNSEDDDSFVLNFEVDDCSGRYTDISEQFDSSEDDDDNEDEDEEEDNEEEDNNEEDGSDTSDTTNNNVRRLRRRILKSLRRRMEDTTSDGDDTEDNEDEEDNDDDDESDSEDSKEFSFDASYFAIEDTANDGAVTVTLCIEADSSDEAEINVIYSHFNHTLSQDPHLGIDGAVIAARSIFNGSMQQFGLSVIVGAMTLVVASLLL